MDSKKKDNKPTPKDGDMIEFPRPVGYSHYGIYVGEGKVVHATSASEGSGSVIQKDTLEKVAEGRSYKVSNQDDKKKPLTPKTIVEQANARIGEKVNYRPLTNNCETFASEMRYGIGQGHSEQGQKIRESAAKAGESFLNAAKDTHNPFEGK